MFHTLTLIIVSNNTSFLKEAIPTNQYCVGKDGNFFSKTVPPHISSKFLQLHGFCFSFLQCRHRILWANRCEFKRCNFLGETAKVEDKHMFQRIVFFMPINENSNVFFCGINKVYRRINLNTFLKILER